MANSNKPRTAEEINAEVIRKRRIQTIVRYVVLIIVGIFMVYPLVWMVGATFKDNNEIFAGLNILPMHPTLEGYRNAVKSYGGDINIWKALINTFTIVIPKVIFTVISATITAYGFGRFEFTGKKILYPIMISTLFLPQVVLNVPQYILYNKLGWVGSPLYLPRTGHRADAYAGYRFLRTVPVHVVIQRLHGSAALRQYTGQVPGFLLRKAVHGLRCRFQLEPRACNITYLDHAVDHHLLRGTGSVRGRYLRGWC